MGRSKPREQRLREGKERNLAWSEMTPKEKLAALNKRLGVDIGAKRQRDKLLIELSNG